MRRIIRDFNALIVIASMICLMFSAGTAGLTAQTNGTKSKPEKNLRTSHDIEADLLKERDRAEFNINLAKRKLGTDADALAKVKSQYTTAWRCTNLLIDDIQHSIREGKNPAASKLFSGRVEEAQKAIAEFNQHVETTLLPAEERPKFLVLLLPLATSLADVLWKSVKEANAAKAAERKIQREELAKKLDEVKFREFDKVPQ